MKSAPELMPLDSTHDRAQSPVWGTARTRWVVSLTVGVATMGLVITTPIGGQAATLAEAELEPVSILTTASPDQPDPISQANAAIAPPQQTALFTPELDQRFATGLLWAFYLSLPIHLIVAIRHYDRQSRVQMLQFVSQAAMLERILHR